MNLPTEKRTLEFEVPFVGSDQNYTYAVFKDNDVELVKKINEGIVVNAKEWEENIKNHISNIEYNITLKPKFSFHKEQRKIMINKHIQEHTIIME
jgi:hypothetical protein